MPYILAVEILTVGSAFTVFVIIVLYHAVLRMNLYLARKVTLKAEDVTTEMEAFMPPLVTRYTAGHDTDGRVSYETGRGSTGPGSITVTTVTLNDDEEHAHAQLREALLED